MIKGFKFLEPSGQVQHQSKHATCFTFTFLIKKIHPFGGGYIHDLDGKVSSNIFHNSLFHFHFYVYFPFSIHVGIFSSIIWMKKDHPSTNFGCL